MANGEGNSRQQNPSSQGRISEHSTTQPVPPDAPVRTFLITDVRGYTRFTQDHGDEEAGRLAAAFAKLARETVLAHAGELIELRGDEALCVFGSARHALRAAVELQLAFRRRGGDGAAFPLPIGVGLDAGEAVPIEGGYRGGALNTAARLCSLAAPGQILATETVISLSRRVEGIRFLEPRRVRLKGLEKPVRVIEVVPEGGLPPLPETPVRKRPWLTGRRLLVTALLAFAALAAIVALVIVLTTGSPHLGVLEPNAIGVIDTDAGGIEAQLTLGPRPGAITSGGGFLWIANSDDGTVSRVDRDLRAVQTVPVGDSVDGLAYGGGFLWATNASDREVVQINPETAQIVQPITVGNGPAAVAVDDEAVWVANTIDGTLSRVDIARGLVTDTILVGSAPAAVAVGAGGVWVASEDTGKVIRVDPVSRSIVQAVNVGNGPASIAVANGQVWVANRQDGTVSRIDAAAGSVTATVPVGANPSAVVAGPDSVWVASGGEGTIARIAPDAGEVVDTVSLGSSPVGLTLAEGKLWATSLSLSVAHRGGVLRLQSEPSLCRCADPAGLASTENLTDKDLTALVYDGLVAYRRAAGIAGSKLVPNLVVRLPAPADGGKTYTFQLRPDVRFSNGARVRPSDFRFSMERLLTVNRNYAHGFFNGILGAPECRPRAGGRCDLSEGIEADDVSGRITIRLTESDPDFLHKLALPLASVIPAGTPLRLASTRLIPGTGPYRVASFANDQDIRLVRNPRFHVWSPDARPDGYADEIRFDLSADVKAGIAAVEKGDADWVDIQTLPLPTWRRVLASHTGRLRSDPSPFTFWFALNTRVPPFDDVRVRRALNYATDRAHLLKFGGGAAVVGEVACQLLPPTFPGFRPHCPYTRKPNPAGIWVAPDLPRARALVQASGTRGLKIEVSAFEGRQTVGLARYFASLLRELGYRTTVRVFPAAEYFPHLADSRNRAQIGQAGWVADILAPSDFLRTGFSCSAFVPGTSANLNFSEYCDPKLDAKMARAAALQAANPLRANELWAQVEHELVDRAVAVPIANPRNRVFISERVGNYQAHPFLGTLFDQLWVK
jgi:YVTN family beta-propeller protein